MLGGPDSQPPIPSCNNALQLAASRFIAWPAGEEKSQERGSAIYSGGMAKPWNKSAESLIAADEFCKFIARLVAGKRGAGKTCRWFPKGLQAVRYRHFPLVR